MRVVVIGAGPVGLTAAMLLAREGHAVTVLDRDPPVPLAGATAEAEVSWELWQRPGAAQFRHPHILLPAGLNVLRRELPETVDRLRELGAAGSNVLAGAWELPACGGRQDGDERFDTLPVRRPVLEAALCSVADGMPGLTMRRGVVVTGLLTTPGRAGEGLRISGVGTRDGATHLADLVIDAGGRNSPVLGMIAELPVPEPLMVRQTSGFLTYTRWFRSEDGTWPPPVPWPVDHHDSLATIALPGDAGTWAVTLCVAAQDGPMRALRETSAWNRVAARYPRVAPWTQAGTPITKVLPMSGMESRRRSLVVAGRPVVTGLLSLGDAWATTNPQFGLGLSMGLTHAVLLRDLLRTVGGEDPAKLALRFDETTRAELEPVHRGLEEWDRHRLEQIAGEIAGRRYVTDDEDWRFRWALDAVKLDDAAVLRAAADVASMLAAPQEALGTPEFAQRVLDLAADAPPYPEGGPSRAEVLAALAAAG